MKEIPLRYLLHTLSLKRIANAGRSLAGYFLSGLLRRNIVWGKPLILTVEPTNLCNLKCPLCITGNGKMTRETGRLSYPMFQQIMQELGDYIFYLLLYQQGEPFINKDFLKFVREAKRKRIFVTTSSNGHYFDAVTAREIVESGLDSMIVSVDGANQESYQRYRVDGRLDKVLEGMRNLAQEKARQRSKRPIIYLQFIVMKHNEHELREMSRLAQGVGADRLLTKTLHVETLDEARTWLPANGLYQRYDLSNDKLRVKGAGKWVCLRPWTSALVNWDGVVAPCCFDKDAEYEMGKMSSEKNFSEIWGSANYTSFRTSMLKNREDLSICANCSQGIRLFI